MKIKIMIVLTSVFMAIALITNGYGKWSKDLKIEGNIKVVPDPNVIEAMELQLANLEQQLNEQINEQILLKESLIIDIEEPISENSKVENPKKEDLKEGDSKIESPKEENLKEESPKEEVAEKTDGEKVNTEAHKKDSNDIIAEP